MADRLRPGMADRLRPGMADRLGPGMADRLRPGMADRLRPGWVAAGYAGRQSGRQAGGPDIGSGGMADEKGVGSPPVKNRAGNRHYGNDNDDYGPSPPW